MWHPSPSGKRSATLEHGSTWSGTKDGKEERCWGGVLDDRQMGRTREGDRAMHMEHAHHAVPPPLAVVILSACCMHSTRCQITFPTGPKCREVALCPVTGMTFHLVTLPLRGWLVPCMTGPSSETLCPSPACGFWLPGEENEPGLLGMLAGHWTYAWLCATSPCDCRAKNIFMRITRHSDSAREPKGSRGQLCRLGPRSLSDNDIAHGYGWSNIAVPQRRGRTPLPQRPHVLSLYS